MFWLVGLFIALPSYIYINTLIPGWSGVILAMTCLLQFAVNLFIDCRYEERLRRYYYWMIWYPMLFWVISAATTVMGLSAALMKDRHKHATWVSPNIGIHQKRRST